MYSMMHHLSDGSHRDILHLICLLLDVTDVCRVRSVSRSLFHLLSDESLWRLIFTYHILPIQYPTEQKPSMCHGASLCEAIGASGYFPVCVLLHRARFPLLGYFMFTIKDKSAYSEEECRGGLIRISLVNDKVLLRIGERTCQLQYNSMASLAGSQLRQPCLVAADVDVPNETFAFIEVKEFELLHYWCTPGGVPLSMKCLCPILNCDPLPPSLSNMSQCLGLVEGLYGPHGTEVIHTRYRLNSTLPGFVLEGVKITGDPNVPAGEVSFSFITAECVTPMVGFLRDEVDTAISFVDQLNMVSVRCEERLPAVVHWCKGNG